MITELKQNITKFMLTYRNITSTSQNQIMPRVTDQKFLIARDPHKIGQVQILVRGICNQPRFSMVRFLKTKVVIPLIHISLRILPRPHYAIHVKQVLGS